MRSVSERDHTQGRTDAPIILVEYGDFECKDCKAASPVVKAVRAALGEDLCFVYRHFPLIHRHPQAEPAAEASEAAGMQNLFWEMHDLLFRRSPDFNQLSRLAREIGADTRSFDRELCGRVHRPRVEKDLADGSASGVHGTPTFFINGIRHEGGRDLASLLAALRATQ